MAPSTTGVDSVLQDLFSWGGRRSCRDRSPGRISCTGKRWCAVHFSSLAEHASVGGTGQARCHSSLAVCHDKPGGDSDLALFNHPLASLGSNGAHMPVWDCRILQSFFPPPLTKITSSRSQDLNYARSSTGSRYGSRVPHQQLVISDSGCHVGCVCHVGHQDHRTWMPHQCLATSTFILWWMVI